jgi:hypothetical protein
MHYLDIKFGMSVGHVITNEEDKAKIINKLARFLKKNNTITTSEQMNVLSKSMTYARYVIDSPIVHLMLCIINRVKMTLFIYENHVIYSPIMFDDELYLTETIFVGHFNECFYIITDVINIKEQNLNAKFKRINYILRNLYHPTEFLDAYNLIFIDYVNPHYLFSLCTDYYDKCIYIKNANITKVVLTDNNNSCHILCQTIITLYREFLSNYCNKYNHKVGKQKGHSETVSLRMYKTDKPDIYDLFSLNKDQYYGIADVSTLEISAYIISIFPPKYVFIITDFVFNDKYMRWCPAIIYRRLTY